MAVTLTLTDVDPGTTQLYAFGRFLDRVSRRGIHRRRGLPGFGQF